MKRKLMSLLVLLLLAGLVLSACGGAAAPAPAGDEPAAAEQPAAAEEEPSAGLGELPRNETLIADILTGRVGSPNNFNEWVGWKWRDRGMQNLANEPMWSIDFATGEI
ncbi:MAG: ABC transporter substrate-binding protein, partial [Caldilineaceae bacterium]|nr:ABC transporter substrate-binding protein [Caldilineaceae bacterium]